MNKKLITIGVLTLLLLTICAASLYAVYTGFQILNISDVRLRGLGPNNVSAKVTEEQILQVDGTVKLTIENDFGSILVSSSADGQVHMTAEKTAWGNNQEEAEAALDDVKVIVDQVGSTIKISVKRPAIVQVGNQTASVNFVIETPIHTDATLYSANGDVTLEGTTGAADVSSSFGKLDIRNLTGSLQAKTNNGAIKASEINASQEMITMSSDFGSIELNKAEADEISVSTSNGTVSLRSVAGSGDLTVRSDFGEIRINGGEAKTADIKSANGSIELEDMEIKGAIKVKSNMGAITLTNVNAKSYDLMTDNGKISLNGAQGTIKAQSSFGDVEVLDAANAILDISSENGALTFSGTLAKSDHKVESSMGNIELTIQPDAALNLNLETASGKIISDFAVTISGEMSSNHWTGTINGGGGSLAVSTQNGNINLNKSK